MLFDVLEQQCRSALSKDALRNFGDLEFGINLRTNALELAFMFEESEKLLEISERHT